MIFVLGQKRTMRREKGKDDKVQLFKQDVSPILGDRPSDISD